MRTIALTSLVLAMRTVMLTSLIPRMRTVALTSLILRMRLRTIAPASLILRCPRSGPRRTHHSHLRPAISLILLAIALLSGSPALAHVSDRGFVMLLPTGHYLAGGAFAVAASFLVLALLPPAAIERLAKGRLVLSANWRPRGRTMVSLIAFAAFVVLLLAGWWGSRDPLSNPLPLTIWTLVWVGLTLVQGTFGNIWKWIDPWYGPCRLIRRSFRRDAEDPFLALPVKVGYWPALLLFFAFAWFELIDPAPDDPARLATVASIYFAVNLGAMLVFGHAVWSRQGECLSAFFGLIARLSVIEQFKGDHRAGLALRWPAAKLSQAAPLPPSGIFFLLLTLASVTFDGLSRTFFWLGLNGINPLEFPGRSAMTAINTAGLLASFAALATAFLFAVSAGERLARSAGAFWNAAGLLVWSIVPIALAYHFSHYLTVLAVNGQYALVAVSDPFGRGWNLFGTAGLQVFPGLTMGSAAAWLVWNLQAGAIILGHVLAVLVAHMTAFRLHPDARTAALSQLPLTLLMIGYTVLGLWLLSTPTGA